MLAIKISQKGTQFPIPNNKLAKKGLLLLQGQYVYYQHWPIEEGKWSAFMTSWEIITYTEISWYAITNISIKTPEAFQAAPKIYKFTTHNVLVPYFILFMYSWQCFYFLHSSLKNLLSSAIMAWS